MIPDIASVPTIWCNVNIMDRIPVNNHAVWVFTVCYPWLQSNKDAETWSILRHQNLVHIVIIALC